MQPSKYAKTGSNAWLPSRSCAHLPRCSLTRRPASTSFLRWWDRVGCEMPSAAGRWQAHAVVSGESATRRSNRSLTGSASALSTTTSGSASVAGMRFSGAASAHSMVAMTRGMGSDRPGDGHQPTFGGRLLGEQGETLGPDGLLLEQGNDGESVSAAAYGVDGPSLLTGPVPEKRGGGGCCFE